MITVVEMSSISIVVLTCYISSLIILVDGQRCAQRRFLPKTRFKPVQKVEHYTEQNWWGYNVQKTRFRNDHVIEYFTEIEDVLVCCSGYTERLSKCQPICIPTCPENSRCTLPNVCTCEFGYTSSSSIANLTVCKPQCSHGCPLNSSCTSPFQCTCDEGYRTELGDSCSPICYKPCPLNAICTAPEVCSCKNGYKRNADGLECVPDCKNGCPLNMYCKSPNECACRTGFTTTNSNTNMLKSVEQSTVANNNVECVPICSEGCPAQSKCVSPEQCRCDMGYTILNEDDDEDDEDDNDNGVFIAATKNSICVPICEKRCPLHATCTSPNQCECEQGYELDHPPQHFPFCRAKCKQNCSKNGKCVAPNICECFEGYEHVNVTSGINLNAPYCQPKCSNGCSNGICFAPEVCVCKPGYLMGAHGQCEPICTKQCMNGRCVEPEICACLEGFQLSVHDYSLCEPICNRTCINADCAAPNVCLCRDKYKPKNDKNGTASEAMNAYECEPMCMPECVNADCVAPDSCSCHAGYIPQTNATTHMYNCVPQCAGGCVNGICLENDTCVCAEGYELLFKDNMTECVPITSPTTTSSYTTKTIASEFPLTTKTEEWLTIDFMTESLTTQTTNNFSSLGAATILLPKPNLMKCDALCYCWKDELDDSDKICREICSLNNDTCLDEQFLYCNEIENRLEYKEGDLKIMYICGVNRTLANHNRDKLQKAESKWLLTTGSIIIVLLTVGIVFLCFRIYQTRHETGAQENAVELLMKL